MGVKIFAKEIVINTNQKGNKILNIKCLPYKKLPFLYLNGKDPVVFKNHHDNGMVLRNGKNLPLEIFVGSIYPKSLFVEILTHISKAEEHLKKVNEELSHLIPMQIPF